MMVKIRYSELPVGLHVSAKAHGRRTIIYLLPGLTPAQRRAALIRVRSSSRMGHGPKLPAVSMAIAIGADRVRTTARNGAAAMRGHPVLLLPPLILLVSTAIVFVLTSFVTLTVHGRSPVAAPGGSLVIPATPARHHLSSGGSHNGLEPVPTPGIAVGTSHHHGAGPAPTAVPTQPGPGPTGSGPSDPAPSSPVPTLSASPTPGPSSSLTSSPTPSPSPSAGLCVKLGPLGLCVRL